MVDHRIVFSAVIPGHEIVGTVVAKGPKVSNLKIGDRAGVGAQVWACHEQSCKDCQSGFDHCCDKRVFTYNSKYAGTIYLES